MSQQGGRPTGPEDEWWGQLYDDSTTDTGPTPTADSLDDRFVSASGAVRSSEVSTPQARPSEARPSEARPSDGRPSEVRPSGVEVEVADPVPGPAAATDWWMRDDPVPRPREDPDTSGASTAPPERPRSRPRAPWEPPPETSCGPTTFPPGPLPAGFADQGAAPILSSEPRRPPPSPAATVLDLPAPAAAPPPSASVDPRRDISKAYVGSGPPTYDAEPTALPAADPDELDDLVADTVLDGARYGVYALRAASVRGDSARYRGEPRRDALLTARFGTGEQALVLVAMATGARAAPGAHRAAAEACRWIARAVGRSHVRLAQDLRAARRGDLKSGLNRLTDRSLGRLRAGAAEQGLDPDEYTATLRCLLLPADPECRTRVFFGVGDGGLFRLRGGEWQDIEPGVGEIAGEPVVGFGALPAETPEGDRLTMDFGIPTPPSPYDSPPEPPRDPFRFRASVARPGDVLLMCTGGLADPLRGEPELARHLTGRWAADSVPPGLAEFLADTEVRVKGYSDDRTAAAVWEA